MVWGRGRGAGVPSLVAIQSKIQYRLIELSGYIIIYIYMYYIFILNIESTEKIPRGWK